MDKICITKKDKKAQADAWQRDQWVKRHADSLEKETRVLDAGAGSSKYRTFFDHCDYKTQDFCQYEGDLVKYLEPIDYVGDIAEIPVDSGAFGAVLCTEVFEHIVDPMLALREFERILKPGGLLLLTAPAASHPHMEPYHYYSGFTEHWYRYWLPKVGFEIGSLTRSGGPTRVLSHAAIRWNQAWKEWESTLANPIGRIASMGCRLIWRPVIRTLIPLHEKLLDSRLRSELACTGFLVAAKKRSS